MENLKGIKEVKSVINSEKSSRNYTISREVEQYFSTVLEAKLKLKTSGLLNGLTTTSNNKIYNNKKVEKEEIKNKHNEQSEECSREKLNESSVSVSNDGDNNNKILETDERPQNLIVNSEIEYVQYESEIQMHMIKKIIQKDLSEPYSIYTYRYFIHNWPKLCFLAMCKDKCVGAIVCKLDLHKKLLRRGYIAMLAVDEKYRKQSIGSTLVRRAIEEMIAGNADEVVLETEVTNKPALRLYEALGFIRDKRLFRYYLNGVDALRLKLALK